MKTLTPRAKAIAKLLTQFPELVVIRTKDKMEKAYLIDFLKSAGAIVASKTTKGDIP